LRPDQYSGPATERRTPGSQRESFIRGGYSIPTIALAGICRLLLNNLSKCLCNLRVALLTVLNVIQLRVRSPDEDDTPEGSRSTTVQNHYIFDLRPEYGYDITKMLGNVLDNNWPSQIPYFRKRRKRPKSPKFILKRGWRPELVKKDKKQRTSNNALCPMATGTTNHQRSTSSLFHSTGTVVDNSQLFQLQERFDLEPPIQDTDQDVDVIAPRFEGQSTCIRSM